MVLHSTNNLRTLSNGFFFIFGARYSNGRFPFTMCWGYQLQQEYPKARLFRITALRIECTRAHARTTQSTYCDNAARIRPIVSLILSHSFVLLSRTRPRNTTPLDHYPSLQGPLLSGYSCIRREIISPIPYPPARRPQNLP